MLVVLIHIFFIIFHNAQSEYRQSYFSVIYVWVIVVTYGMYWCTDQQLFIDFRGAELRAPFPYNLQLTHARRIIVCTKLHLRLAIGHST